MKNLPSRLRSRLVAALLAAAVVAPALASLGAREKLVLPAPVDIAFLDPPFALFAEEAGRAFLKELLADVRARLVRPQGRVVLRYEKRHAREACEALAALSAPDEDVRAYGRSVGAILTLP